MLESFIIIFHVLLSVFFALNFDLILQIRFLISEYLQIVSNDISLNGEVCVESIHTSFEQLENILKNETSNNITAIFNLCSEFKNPLKLMDKLHLYENIIDSGFAMAAQSHRANITMDKICELMTNKSFGTELDRLGKVMSLVNREECFEAYWDKYVEDLKNETIDKNLMSE